MIDMIVLRCSFLREYRLLQLDSLPITREFRKDESGYITNVRHPWESLPSYYHSLAVKVNAPCSGAAVQYQPYVEIKASPAKIMFGHNVYGSDNLSVCSYALISEFTNHYPEILDMLDINSWRVISLDITYASFCDTESDAKQVISFLSNISHGQTKSSKNQYDTTSYFGSTTSRLKRSKVYLKHIEVLVSLDRLKKNRLVPRVKYDRIKEVHTDSILEFSKKMIRWESTVKSRWLERNGYSTDLMELSQDFDAKEIWSKSMSDVFKSFQGQTMKHINEDNIFQELQKHFKKRKAKNLYNFYKDIKTEGYQLASSENYISRASLMRYLNDFSSLGYSKAYLQNIKPNGHINIIPLVRFTSVDFGKQYPDDFDIEKFDREYFISMK